MAVKPVTFFISSHYNHIVILRPTVHCKSLPHHPSVFCSAIHQDHSCRKQKDHPSEEAFKMKRWRNMKSSIQVRASQVYSQVVNAKEFGKLLSWNVPSMISSNGYRFTVVQPLKQSAKGKHVSKSNKNLNMRQMLPETKSDERKPMKRVKLKRTLSELSDVVVKTSNSVVSGNVVGKQPNNEMPCENSGKHLSSHEEDFTNNERKSSQILQSQEIGQNLQTESVSRFKYGIFDVDSLIKRIQEQFTLSENLINSKAIKSESRKVSELEEDNSLDSPNLVKYSEEFETGKTSDVYGDVIIQFRPKSGSEVEKNLDESFNPSVSTIFRDNLYEWEKRNENEIVKAADPRGDISKEVSSSFFKEFATKADVSSLLNQILLLKQVQLPSITESIQRFNKKFIKEQSQPIDNEMSASDKFDCDVVDGMYFDTNAPLIDMTQVIGEMEQWKRTEEKKKTGKVNDRGADEGTIEAEESQKMRKSKVHISQMSIKSRMKSLAITVSKPSTSASSLLKLQRLCKHLSEYPESRDIAVQENLIPILLRRRDQCDSANQAEIRRALALMGYADPVKGKGIRILSVDGGGSRGVIPIQILKTLEASCKQKIGDMFDFVIGVSSGAVTAFLLSLANATVEDCEQLYKELSGTVFGRNRFLGTSNLVLNHAFYDTEGWIKMLREYFQGMGNLNISETARDPTCPKVAAVATLMNVGTLRDYLFRNYNLPPGSISFYQGSAKYRLWEALRASSAAPGYFEEFKLDDYVFQDGGVLTNNPCALAVHECRLLWPDTPIQCVVSVGTGRYDPMDQEFPAEYSSLRTKLFKVLCSATDTEAVHIILKDLLPAGKYFRFNPILSEDFLMDESNPERLEKMQRETREYLARNELKLMQATGVLTREKSGVDKALDWITLQKKMRIPRRQVSYWRD